MYIGEVIKRYRSEHKLSMQDFANISGLSKAYIGLLEKIYNPLNGQPIAPSIPKVKAIANAMGMELDELLQIIEGDQLVRINTSLPPLKEGYYTDPEVAEYANKLKNNPDMRLLFDAAEDMTKDDIDFVVNMIENLKKREGK